MSSTIRVRPALGLAFLVVAGACSSENTENHMGSNPKQQPGGQLESDPALYKLNSVMGVVSSGGKPVKGATVTILKTKESFPIGAGGDYIIELDPERLGAQGHELAFSAPGYVEQRHFVVVPENNQTRLDVELVPVKK